MRFLFDGERLNENRTPKDLNMENGDEIDVVIEQVGGAFWTYWFQPLSIKYLDYYINMKG